MKNTDTQKQVELKEYDFRITYDCRGFATILAEDLEQAYELAWELHFEDPEVEILHVPVSSVSRVPRVGEIG